MTPLSTLVPEKTPPESVRRVPSDDKPSTFPPCDESTRPSPCSPSVPENPLSTTSSPSRNVSLMNWSTPPRVPPTLTPSRRRTSSSVSPSPTVNLSVVQNCTTANPRRHPACYSVPLGHTLSASTIPILGPLLCFLVALLAPVRVSCPLVASGIVGRESVAWAAL